MKRANYLLSFLFVFQLQCIEASSLLAVFYPSSKSSKHREKSLKKIFSKNQVKPVVFAKYKEFSSLIKRENIPLIMAPSSFGVNNKDYRPLYQFQNNKKDQFQYLVISLDKNLKLNKIKKIGVVQELKRKKMNKFVKEILNKKNIRISRVMKAEDIFLLLALENVDSILVTPEQLSHMKKQYKSKLYFFKTKKLIKYPQLYIKKGLNIKDYEEISRLGEKNLINLGFSGINKLNSK
jgi:hypothetical protein